MKISEIKNELLTTLSPCVLNHGFKVNKTKFCLKKNDENNESQFSFDYNSWGDEIHLFPYVQIKNKMIHSIKLTTNLPNQTNIYRVATYKIR